MDQLEELHPVRYAQVPHEALDGLPDLNSIGMLATMLRHQPNFPFTVERVIKQKKQIPGPKLGEAVAYGAMTTLIKHRWAARVKFRCAGGHMHTSLFRTAQQFTTEDYRTICKRFVANTEKVLHCRGCSKDPQIPVRTTIRSGATLQWVGAPEKHGAPISQLLAPGGALTGSGIPGTGVTSKDEPVPGFPGAGEPGLGNPGTFKNNTGEQEGEEGDRAPARETDPSPDDEPQWGVTGARRSARPTLEDADVITDLARQVMAEGEVLTADEHQELAGQVRAVRPVVEAQPGLSWAEYEAWLGQGWLRPDGTAAYKMFSRALSWRLQPERVKDRAWVWACQRRGAREESEARGARKAPERTEHEQTCGRHDTTLLDGRCVPCAEEDREAEAQRRADEEAAAATADYVEYTDEDVADIGIDPEFQEKMRRDLEARKEKSRAAKEAQMKRIRDQLAKN